MKILEIIKKRRLSILIVCLISFFASSVLVILNNFGIFNVLDYITTSQLYYSFAIGGAILGLIIGYLIKI